MAEVDQYPMLPWVADPEDRDGEMFRVVRANDGRPLLYVDKSLSQAQSENVCRLIVNAPRLLTLTRRVFYGTGNADGTIGMAAAEWRNWRQQIGPLIADCWPVEWDGNER